MNITEELELPWPRVTVLSANKGAGVKWALCVALSSRHSEEQSWGTCLQGREPGAETAACRASQFRTRPFTPDYFLQGHSSGPGLTSGGRPAVSGAFGVPQDS
jgi:hypothetical protein